MLFEILLTTFAATGLAVSRREAIKDRVGRDGRASGPLVGGYFPNWAQWRTGNYKFTPSNLQPIISEIDYIWYAFAFFCPDSSMVPAYWVTQLGLCQGVSPFNLVWNEDNDKQYVQQIAGFKNQNSDLKFILSIGGWTFPSNYFSGMVASKTNRQTFIESCKQWMTQYQFDGIDIDWEYPCSDARTDEVKITCTDMEAVDDEGGKCPDDKNNLVLLFEEMRAAFGDEYIITMAAQADLEKTDAGFNLTGIAAQIDFFNLMTYDFTVSDISDSSLTAPNEPLYPPSASAGVSEDSVDTTVQGYLQRGVSAGQLVVGVSFYGHTWYIPGQSDWKKFGVPATIQGECCKPFDTTYGAKYGPGSQQCGLLMYSEIVNAGYLSNTYFENTTMSDIGYLSSDNTWLAYQGKDAVSALVAYAQKYNLAGVFSFDYSMDDSQWTLLNVMTSAF